MSFFEELKRRNVVRVAIAYLITSWLLMQVVDLVLENVSAPEWVMQVFMLLMAVGFPIALIFAWAFEMTPEGIKKEKDVDRAQSITSQTGRKLDFTIIGILALAVAFLLFDRFATRPETPSASGTELAAETEASAERAKSVAVLPFVNMSSDPEQEYFSDGISEEILNSLARVKELKVAGRTSSFAFKGQNQDLRKIGETLGVEHILEGSVRKSGNTVRITAQLVQVEDGFHLWSDTYDRELDNVFAIQDEIARAILEQLKAQLIGGEEQAVTSSRTDSKAYDSYLLAKQRIYERSRPALELAAEMLDKAIAIDPEYAPAYAQRGITTLLLSVESYGTIPEEQADAQAKLYLDQALRLDPQLPEGLAGLGLYYLNRPGQTDNAIETLEQALAINPNMVNASNWLQTAYSNAGRIADSERILEQMIELDPLYRPGLNNIMLVYNGKQEVDKAWALIERVRPFMPTDPLLKRMEAGIYFGIGQPAKGLVLVEEARELEPQNFATVSNVGFGLMQTAQYERLAEEGAPWQRVIGLNALGRLEESTILAREIANIGEDVGTLMGLLANTGRQEEMIGFFEERWPSLDAFDKDFPILGTGGVNTMLDIAYAYASVGNQERFDEAMNRARTALDILESFGYQNWFMTFLDGLYATLAGEEETALALLAAAVDKGLLVSPRMSVGWSALKALEGNPEYEAIQARMVENMNAERGALGLEPVST
jgi:TolB-like protein